MCEVTARRAFQQVHRKFGADSPLIGDCLRRLYIRYQTTRSSVLINMVNWNQVRDETWIYLFAFFYENSLLQNIFPQSSFANLNLQIDKSEIRIILNFMGIKYNTTKVNISKFIEL